MPARSSLLRPFLIGLAIGVSIGLCQIAWFRLDAGWTKYPEPYVGFWGLMGAVCGLVVRAFCNCRK